MEGLVLATVLTAVGVWFAWVISYGVKRGSFATLLRGLWILPFALAFFPETRFENLPRTIALKPIHVLIDDSQSVVKDPVSKESMERYLNELRDECIRLGCALKEAKLSELSSETKDGYTPLSKVLESWFYSTAGEPWVVISDGGDYRPAQAWSSKFKGFGRDITGKERGLVIGLIKEDQGNLWLEGDETPLFSFADRPLEVGLTIKRTRDPLAKETVQIQVSSEDSVLATHNATFSEGETVLNLSVPLSSLPKGQHLLTIKALPSAEESALWDNVIHQSVEVLPNTIGILHLLGAPTWDGRFLRRYLKAEPKFDLISFFILRDPGDMQLTNERELSLIPFPVERLFNEELPNFHVVILQNFALYQFLESTYQKNLVEFVKNGGGLLFLGGPRALQPGDANNSSLSSILPFTTASASGGEFAGGFLGRLGEQDRSGPFYDAESRFRIALAEPTKEQKDLANIFDDFAKMIPQLSSLDNLKGLHHVENVKFKGSDHTPLLTAVTPSGDKVPLAVASYPGKGRALWVFSDSLYRMGLNPGDENSRDLYQNFMATSLNWLLRQELKKPLTIRHVAIDNSKGVNLIWSLNFLGTAGKYLRKEGDWQVRVCGQLVAPDAYQIEKTGFENWEMSGSLSTNLVGGAKCDVEIQGEHPAFGSVKARASAIAPEVLKDSEVLGSPQKLAKLVQLTGARFVTQKDKSDALADYLDLVTGRYGVSYPSRFRTVQDHFWVLNKWWFYLLLLGLPLEVVVRRWPQLTSSKKIESDKPSSAGVE